MWWKSHGGLGLLPGEQVIEYSANVSVYNPTVFKDGTAAVLGLQDKLSDLGFLARILNPSIGYQWSSFKVILSKNKRAPFSVSDAQVALKAAVTAQSLSLKAFGENAAEVVKFIAEVPSTALSEKGRQQTKDTLDKGFWDVWATIPTSVKVIGGVAVGLFALSQATTIVRAFKGVE